MYTMAENVIAAGSENRPPMLERRTATSPATVRERTLDDLTIEEKILAREIWDKVKLLMEGLELSLQERESKLYNEFDRFTFENEENIHSYYLRFAKLINDMNTIGMSMEKRQNHDTIQDGRVTVQNVQGRQTKGYAGNVAKGNATGTRVIRNMGNTTANQAKEARVALDEEQLSFLGYTRERVESGTNARVLTTTAIFQTDDIDAFDSDYDKAPTSSAVFIANLTSYDLDILSEYLKGNENEVVQCTTSPEQQDDMIMSIVDEMSNHVAKCNAVNKKNKITNESLTVKLE
ncbi:hypothetical protein Tco_0526612 [Tanacetum coccineum]